MSLASNTAWSADVVTRRSALSAGPGLDVDEESSAQHCREEDGEEEVPHLVSHSLGLLLDDDDE